MHGPVGEDPNGRGNSHDIVAPTGDGLADDLLGPPAE
jgi:hypothetical protein